MNEYVFPPAPNWYLNTILACSSNDTVIYGSRSSIVIVKAKNESEPQVSTISCAHKERVTCIALSTFTNESHKLYNCLASTGDDSVVKIWNLNTLLPLLAHASHVVGHKLCCMDWSRADPNLIVSADESGVIVCWNVSSNCTRNLHVGKLTPRSLSCCPHKAELLAVGTASGLVCIINIKGAGKVLYRLRGHDTEVVSLSWCPVAYNVFHQQSTGEPEPSDDMLLASGSKHRAVYIWRAGGDGRYEGMLNMPNNLTASQNKSDKSGGSESHWVSVNWVEPNLLLTGTMSGRLLSWNLQMWHSASSNSSKPKSGAGDSSASKAWKLLHSAHVRGLFTVACKRPVPQDWWEGGDVATNGNDDDKENWKSAHNRSSDNEHQCLVWTTAVDRLLVACNVHSGEIVHSIPTIGGIVYCIAASPIDHNRVAFGAGDALIRVWNLSNSNVAEITSLWQKVKAKVTALAWHPSRENWLAYGTNEGRVGLFDISVANQPPVLFRLHHRHTLYSLSWGPQLITAEEGAEASSKISLYSCGDYEIMQYNPSKPDAEPKNLKNLKQLSDPSMKKTGKCDLAWKPDNSMLAIGNENGTVQILCVNHKGQAYTLYSHKKVIHCLAWHPQVTATDADYSPYQHWLAIASKESNIKVFDLSHLAMTEADVPGNNLSHWDNSSHLAQNVMTLEGHKTAVVNLCWSPHISGQLVSVSYDESAQVWDVPHQQPLGNYRRHCGLVYCCAWSSLDPDLVITGAADCTLRIWRISVLENKLPPEKKKLKQIEKKKQVHLPEIAVTSTEDVLPAKEVVSADSSAVVREEEEDPVSMEFATSQSASSSKGKAPKVHSFFPVSAKQWNQGTEHNLAHCHRMLQAPDEAVPGFFGDRTNVLQLLDLEEQHHVKCGNGEYAQQMELWKGNLNETLKDAICKNKLSDWLVSMAPMVSQRLWQECCQAYAQQLSQAGCPQKAVSYLLACHKVDKAIELLTSHKLFREAVSIARCRLDKQDPILAKLVLEWSHHLSASGNYELAAECLISLGELVEAASLLGRRNDEGSLRLAASIALQTEAWDLALSYATHCARQSLLRQNWKVAFSLAAEHDILKHFTLLIFTHKTIIELLEEKRVPEIPLPELIIRKYEEEYPGHTLDQMYAGLEKGILKMQIPDSEAQVWLAVSEDVALSCCITSSRLHHLVDAAAICYQYQLLHPGSQPLYQFISFLAPQGPFNEDSLFRTNPNSIKDVELQQSLKSYLYAGIFQWLEYKVATTNGEASVSKDWLTDAVPVLENYAASIESDIDAMVYIQDLIDIKKWENKVATTVAKRRQTELSLVVRSDADDPVEDTKVINHCRDAEENVDLQKLEALKKRKEIFEKKRKSTPNLLITFCKFRYVCQCLMKENGMNVVDKILSDAESSWQKLQLSAKDTSVANIN